MEIGDYKALFVSEAGDILQNLEEGVMSLETGQDKKSVIEESFRHAHNLKGMSGAMGYHEVVEASHALENILDSCKKGVLEVGPAEADLLLRVTDLLRSLVDWAVSEEKGPRGEDLLGEILVLLAPMSTRRAEAEHSLPDPVVMTQEMFLEGNRCGSRKEEIDLEISGETASTVGGIKSTKVDLEKLDALMDLVGELIISRIRLSSIAAEVGSRTLDEELAASGRLVSEIQKEVMEARLVPVGQVFHRFKRLARDTARELGKNVKFELVGSDIGLDRTVLESMVDPMVHLIRNAIDHGVEAPEERIAAGKNVVSKVTLSAKREKNNVVLEVMDDGRGIDIEKIRKRGGYSDHDENLEQLFSSDDLCSILTESGFSTRDNVSRYSGRGIGMNIAKEMIDSLGGSLEIDSIPGEGTTITMHLPINLSIIKALLFYAGGEIHALPIEYVRETTRVEQGTFRKVMGTDVMETSGGPIPIIRPAEIFKMDLDEDADSRFIKVIIVGSGDHTAALVVNRILGQQDIVIKSLPSMIRGVSGISGATILGSGKIAFIWDPKVLFHGRSTHESDQEAVVLEN